MSNVLSPAQLEQYQRQGYLFPLDVYTKAEAAELRNNLEVNWGARQWRSGSRSCTRPQLKLGYPVY